MVAYLLLGFSLGLIIAYLGLLRRHRPKFLASAEYWVFLPGETMPDQNVLMSRIVQRRGIGPAEGLVMSDVRLSIGLVRRAANPSPFRPDLFADADDLDPDRLQNLDASQSFVRLRYISEEPLPDKRHLRFLVHAADTVADMAGGELIYDSTAEKLFTRAELHGCLVDDPNADSPDIHLRVLWRTAPHGGWAETRGMRKVGRDDLRTYESEGDERVLVKSILEEACRQIWAGPMESAPLEVEAFEDRFQIVLEPASSGFSLVRILRVQSI